MVTGGLFLLAGAIALRRGESGDWLMRGPVIANRGALGLAFLILAVAVSGLPPLSGFFGKLLLLQGIEGSWQSIWWAALLLSGLGVALVLARVGSILFWEPEAHSDTPVARARLGMAQTVGLTLLVAASPLFVIAAQPVASYAESASGQLHDRRPYLDAVIPPGRAIVRDARPTPVEEVAP
jgi:multicomponent K+:H+ antiporter subunit D